MKIFISQPMKGLTDKEIQEKRNITIQMLKSRYGSDIEIIDSFFEAAPIDVAPLWFLGKSLELLSTADYVYFMDGWDDARGCQIEHSCAKEYGIKIINE